MRQLLFLAGPVVASFALIHCVGDAPAVPIDAGTDAPVTGDGSADTSSDVAADTGKPCDPLPDGGTGFLDDAVGISAGDDFTCAVRLNGDVLCWGSNSPYQQLAQPIGNLMRSSVPVRITGFPTKVVKVSAGQGQGKALDDQRHAWSWGSNIFGEAGTNEAYGIFLNAPHKVVGVSGTGSLDNVVDVSAGEDHACAADSTGKVYCWGEAGNGRLGSDVLNDAGQPKTNIPVATKTLAGTALAVSAANTFTCAIVRDGSSNQLVQCWGSNSAGQLGASPSAGGSTPQTIPNLSAANALLGVSIHDFACSKGANFEVTCWGSNQYGQIGASAPPVFNPVKLYDTNVKAIATGNYNTCVIQADGTVKCMGKNSSGQLGQGTSDANPHPVPDFVVDASGSGKLQDVFAISAGGGQLSDGFVCGIVGKRAECGGSVFCWGTNSKGQLGNGVDVSTVDNTRVSSKPVRVVAPAN